VREEVLELRAEEEPSIPVSVWTPEAKPRAVVLLGHGLGVDRSHSTVQIPAEHLVERLGIAVVAPDLPIHGVRRGVARDPAEIVAAWQAYWASGGAAALRDEWVRIAVFARERFAGARLGYFGLSLGTQYGVVFIANAPQIAAAVLGLFGSEPPPKSAILNTCAPRVRCPVYFVQKQDDEIHSRASTDHLYATLGSDEKVLDSSPGLHAAVSPETLQRACEFLARHL
jgi:predicted alpha/beta-hydrolase family hydrolase